MAWLRIKSQVHGLDLSAAFAEVPEKHPALKSRLDGVPLLRVGQRLSKALEASLGGSDSRHNLAILDSRRCGGWDFR
jgi:hypothetical protein